MQEEARFSAELKAAKLVARNDDDKIMRRVQFALTRDFSIEIAEWLGEVAIGARNLLIGRQMNRVEIPIDGYYAKAKLAGMGGNADIDVDGVKVVASVVGEDDDQREVITVFFEAFPESKLLSFLASALKGTIDCYFERSQLTIEDRLRKLVKPARKAAEDNTEAPAE